jgi:class 3 adenylate cyclase/tetratricopeptide (TPR) repeat protein
MPRPEQPGSAERRFVSILFIDLEDFSGLVERLDSEDARALQSRYFTAVRSAVEHHGGTVEKYIGDAVVAVWGTPLAHEDDGERAVLAALLAVDAAAEVRDPDGRPLRARAAVASGEVTVGEGVDGSAMLTGEPLILAARLQTAAPVGGVLVDGATRGLARRAVTFRSAGRQELKGRSRPVDAWHARGRLRGGGQRAGRAEALVGRDAEMAVLSRALAEAAQGDGRLISVLGEAGLGKTRLRLELEASLRDHPLAPLVLVAAGPAHGAGQPFEHFNAALSRWAGIDRRDTARTVGRRIERALAAIADDPTRSWLVPRLAAFVARDPAAADFARDELFAAWRRLIELMSDRGLCVLLLEDVHRADPGTLEMIEHLGRWSHGQRLLMVLFARPSLLDNRPDWASSHTRADRLALQPLPDASMRRLLSGLEPGLTRREVELIVERAGGVPLYAVEFVRMRRAGIALDPAHLPDSLRALVAAHLDALPTDERRRLMQAAVLGRRFDTRWLAALPAHASSGRRGLAGLVARHLLEVTGDRGAGPAQVSFVQEIVRDVAYRTMSRADRRDLHRRVADLIAAERSGAPAEELAEHLWRAVEGSYPAERDEGLVERARAALAAAAEVASQMHVPAAALRQLERALTLEPPAQERLQLLGRAAAAARAAGSFDRAEELLRELIERRTALGDGAVARDRAQLASLLLAAERHGAAIDELDQALAGLPELDTDAAGVELAGQLARARVLIGDDQQAERWADRTIRAARRLGLSAAGVDALITRGTARVRLGADRAGMADLRRAIAGAGRTGLVRSELRGRNNLAWLVVLDDPHLTLETARAGMQLADRMGLADMYLQLGQVRSLVAIDTGDWDEALAVIDELREHPQSAAHHIQSAATEATIRGLRGEPGASRPLRALLPLDPATDPQMAAAFDLARAWIRFAEGRHSGARRAATGAAGVLLGAERHVAFVLAARAALWKRDERAVRHGLAGLTAMRERGRVVTASTLTLRAGAGALAGSPDAPALYDEAESAWRQLRLPLHLALCLAERGSLLGGGHGEAEAILTGLGASTLLRRLTSATLEA